MKNNLLRTVLFALTVFFTTAVIAQEQLQTIPQHQKYTSHEGSFVLNANTQIKSTAKNFEPNVQLLEKLKSANKGKANQIELIENKLLKDDAYRLTITNTKISIEAASASGAFYAVQTIIQNLSTNASITAMEVEDYPRYEWRGMMLDYSRHFFDKETTFEFLDILARLKMNRFHMHLTDEDGWRIEIKQYPKLTEIGSKGNWGNMEAPHKFFTQEDIKEIIAYAAERHIMVIPEIDMPGHATAASFAYPEISGGGSGRWIGFTFHPAKEEVYTFLDNVLTEIAELFPAPYIHIGGDEVHFGNESWSTDPEILAFKREKGLKDAVDLEHYFLKRMCDIVNSKGKKMLGWDEILLAGLKPEKASVFWWRHDKPEILTQALELGFDVVMTPRRPCYFDFVQHDTQEIGRRWEGYNPLDQVYDFTNDIASRIEGYEGQILGLQASTWTERIADKKRLQYMVLPRIAAIAENAWTELEHKEYKGFEYRLKPFFNYLDSRGMYYFNPFNVESTPEPWGPTIHDTPKDDEDNEKPKFDTANG